MSNKLLVTDFDGILGKDMIYSRNGKEFKTINFGNRDAIKLLNSIGYKIICLSTDSSNIGRKISKDLCESLGIEYYNPESWQSKLEFICSYMKANNYYEFDYIGDDLNDYWIGKFARKFFTTLKLNSINKNLRDNITILESINPFIEVATLLSNNFEQKKYFYQYNMLSFESLMLSLYGKNFIESNSSAVEYFKSDSIETNIRLSYKSIYDSWLGHKFLSFVLVDTFIESELKDVVSKILFPEMTYFYINKKNMSIDDLYKITDILKTNDNIIKIEI